MKINNEFFLNCCDEQSETFSVRITRLLPIRARDQGSDRYNERKPSISFVKSFLASLLLLGLLASCASDDVAIDRSLDYKDFIKDDMADIGAASSASKRVVTVPTVQDNYFWNNSNFSLAGIPDNIYGPEMLKSIKKYSYSSSDYHINRTVAISDTLILWLAENKLYAYDVNHPSNLKWSVAISHDSHEFVGGGVYVKGDYIAATCGSNDLAVIDSRNGHILWTFSLANIARSTPLIYKETVIINTVDNILYGFDLNTGLMKWLVKEAHEKLGFLGSASPEFFEDTIIMPFSSGKLIAMNVADGQLKWSSSLSLGLGVKSYINDVDMVPVVKNNAVFLSSSNGVLYAIDAKTGTPKWSNLQAGGGGQVWSAGDYVYTINKNNILVAVYKGDGSVQWSLNLQDPSKKKSDNIFFEDVDPMFRGPTMANGRLYITSSEGSLLVVDAISGHKIDEISVSDNIFSPAIVVNGKIYLISSSGSLSVIG